MSTILSGAELDTLVALIECGPCEDGDVPSKNGRDSLISRGYAVRIVIKKQDGYTAATYAGRDAYKTAFGTSMGGAADTIAEAFANRIASRLLGEARGGAA